MEPVTRTDGVGWPPSSTMLWRGTTSAQHASGEAQGDTTTLTCTGCRSRPLTPALLSRLTLTESLALTD